MALLSVLGPQGTLVMPSHSGDWSDPTNWSNPPVPNHWISIIKESMPAYDKNLTCTRKMGKISELFRLQPGVIRSEQPQLSFSAIGPLAKTIINGEQTFPQLGMNSPLGKCYELKAKVLLMGVDYDSNTCFHLAETLIPMMKSELCGSPILINGKRTWHEFIDFDYDSSDFLLCGENFEMTDRVSINDIGCGRSKLFSIIDAVDFAKKWLLINRKF
jgi:aminoglycoside 3-N-acetyltransferase